MICDAATRVGGLFTVTGGGMVSKIKVFSECDWRNVIKNKQGCRLKEGGVK